MKPFLNDDKNAFLRAMQRLHGPRVRAPADWPTSFLIGVLLGAVLLFGSTLWWN